MSVDWSSSQAPPEIAALYADSVQEVCRALSTRALKDIWLKLVATARTQGLREAELGKQEFKCSSVFDKCADMCNRTHNIVSDCINAIIFGGSKRMLPSTRFVIAIY